MNQYLSRRHNSDLQKSRSIIFCDKIVKSLGLILLFGLLFGAIPESRASENLTISDKDLLAMQHNRNHVFHTYEAEVLAIEILGLNANNSDENAIQTKELVDIKRNEILNLTKYDSLGHVGWGISKPWDAFSDGTSNDDSTAYTFTTILISLAFLESYISFGDETYLNLTNQSLAFISNNFCCSFKGESSYLYYSDNVNDRRKEFIVSNVNALFLRLVSNHLIISLNSEKNTDHVAFENGIIHEIEIAKKRTLNGYLFYSSGDKSPLNDLTHQLLTLYGLQGNSNSNIKTYANNTLKRIFDSYSIKGKIILNSKSDLGSIGSGSSLLLLLISQSNNCDRGSDLYKSILNSLLGSVLIGSRDTEHPLYRGLSPMADRLIAWKYFAVTSYRKSCRNFLK